MLPIQTQADPRVNKTRSTKRELAASPPGAVVPQADQTSCLQQCSNQQSEASFRICMALCEYGG